jgi:hypothetical protein
MPSFLEHISTFHLREEPHLQASFRTEVNLRAQRQRLEHCFNFVGVEYDKFERSSTGSFKYRQAAAYFSFDLATGKSMWIIVKANSFFRTSFQQYTQNVEGGSQPSTPSKAFSLSIRSHLLIFEWVIQNWTPYVNSLLGEHSSLRATVAPLHPDLTGIERQMQLLRRSTVLKAPKDARNWVQRCFQFISTPRAKNIPLPNRSHSSTGRLFDFNKMQMLQQQIQQVQDSLSVLDQNKTVLRDMVEHFQYLVSSARFPIEIIDDEDFRNFVHRAERYTRELESQHIRLSALKADKERVMFMVSNLICPLL